MKQDLTVSVYNTDIHTPGMQIDAAPSRSRSWVGNYKHRGGSIEDAAEGLAKRLRVKRREALVKDNEGRVLKERPGDIEAAPFAVGELPTRLAD